ncbi:MAG: hypothetical protein ACO1TE_03750 [Prosthecobacter sp.]
MTNLRGFMMFLGLVLVGAILTAMLVWPLDSRGRIEEDYPQDVQALQRAFPLLEADKVTAIRHQDWCQVLGYARGNFANTTTTTCCFIVEEPRNMFDEQARADLERIWKEIQATQSGVFEIARIRYGPTGKLIFAEFDCSSGFSRERYVFDPGHTLPADVPAERLHTKINADWYHVREDWN